MPVDRRADSRTPDARHRPPAWLREDACGVRVEVHLQPGARRSAVCGEFGGRLKIAVAAPPLDGRANQALIGWLADRLDLPRRQVSLVAGLRSRDKTVQIVGATATEVARRLTTA